MAEAGKRRERSEESIGGPALLLLQAAAARAEIGPFARRGRATPQWAARVYRAVASLHAVEGSRRPS